MSNYPTLLPVPVTSESATVCVLSEPQAINLSNNATYFSTISTTTILQSKAQFREFPLKKNHKFQKFLDRSDHRNFKKKIQNARQRPTTSRYNSKIASEPKENYVQNNERENLIGKLKSNDLFDRKIMAEPFWRRERTNLLL